MSDKAKGQEKAEGKQQKEVTAKDKPADVKTPPAEDTKKEDSLPSDVKERTRREFEKLKARNKKMQEELAQLKGQKTEEASVLDDVVPSEDYAHLSKQEVEAVRSELVDEEGYINIQALQKALNEANERAKRAEERAMRAEMSTEKYEQHSQMKEAQEIAPEFDPYNRQFNPVFYDMVKAELLRRGDKNVVAATKKVKAELDAEKIALDEQKEKEEAQRQRAQASVQPKGGAPRATERQYDEIVERSRAGDVRAIGERLQRSGF